MSDHVTIKRIGNESIILEDIYASEFSILYFSLWVGFIMIAAMCMFFLFFDAVASTNRKEMLYITVILCWSLLFYFILGLLGFFNKSFPTYKIFIIGHNESGIIIEKTTPEQDQVAICKAVQELEIKSQELDRKKKEMELIAARCR